MHRERGRRAPLPLFSSPIFRTTYVPDFTDGPGPRNELEARRERLELPAIDKEMLKSLVDNLEKVMAEGPNPKKRSTFSTNA